MKLFFIGLFSGIISGMGIGGGSLLIPALVFLTELNQKQAQGINLIVYIPVAIIALIVHSREGNIEFKYAKKIILAGLLGAVLGSFLALKLSPASLKRYFGIFLLFVGGFELVKKDIG